MLAAFSWVLLLLFLKDVVSAGIDYIYMRVLDPPGLLNPLKLSLARIGPQFNITTPTYLSHFTPENGCSQTSEIYFDGAVYVQPLAQSIALIARGGCSFVTKVINAHIAGAVAAVIYDLNPRSTQTFSMIQDETTRRVLIPCAFMNGKDGHTLTTALGGLNTTRALVDFPFQGPITSPSKQVHFRLWPLR